MAKAIPARPSAKPPHHEKALKLPRACLPGLPSGPAFRACPGNAPRTSHTVGYRLQPAAFAFASYTLIWVFSASAASRAYCSAKSAFVMKLLRAVYDGISTG